MRGPGRLETALQYAIVLWAAVTLNFALPRLAPGDPLEYVIGPELEALSPEQRARVRAEIGLEGTLLEQYGRYLAGLAKGDLGTSIRYARPVAEVLIDRIPWTLLLVLPALLAGFTISVLLGIAAARRRGRWPDVGVIVGTLFVDSLPVFWIALLLLTVFAVQLGWLPSFGAEPLVPAASPGEYAIEVGRRLILPWTAMIIGAIGHTVLLARASMIDTMDEDYIAMAEAKGLSQRRITYRHALRNALLPLYTHFVLSLGGVLGGAVLIETVFGYPGVGRVIFEAVSSRDYPLLQGAFLLVTVGVIVANFIADATYGLLDPRIRAASRRGA